MNENQQKSYFSIVELVVYFFLTVIVLQIFAAIPPVLELIELPQSEWSVENISKDSLILGNIIWQILLILTLLLVFTFKKIQLRSYLHLDENLSVRFFLYTIGTAIAVMGIIELISVLANIEQNPIMVDIVSNTDPLIFIITAVILAPVAEELLFRGWLYRELEIYTDKVVAIAITSGLFTLIHIQYSAIEMLLVLIIGISLGLLRSYYNNLLYPIILHFINNLASAIYFYTTLP
jgi:membrane protease YdiL (CAAX protease family)